MQDLFIQFIIHSLNRGKSENIIIPEKNNDSVLISFAALVVDVISPFLTIQLLKLEKTHYGLIMFVFRQNHDLIDRKKMIRKSVKIGKNCWIGSGAVLLPGVILGDNVTVGANATVTKSFSDNCVVGGISPLKL